MLNYQRVTSFFFQSYLLGFAVRQSMWPASKITMTPSDTINAGCSGPGWREAIWWRPLVMNPVKSHSWSLVFWSWKLRPLLCASAMFKLIHHGCATRLFCRGPMKMKDFKMLQVFFFCVEGSWRNPAWFWKKTMPEFHPPFRLARVVGSTARATAHTASADATPTPWWLAWNCDLVPLESELYKTHMGLSENRVYSQWNSHLIGIMISKTIGFRGTLFSDTPIYWHEERITKTCWTMVKHLSMNFYRWVLLCFTCNPTHFLPKLGGCLSKAYWEVAAMRHGQHSRLTEASMQENVWECGLAYRMMSALHTIVTLW